MAIKDIQTEECYIPVSAACPGCPATMAMRTVFKAIGKKMMMMSETVREIGKNVRSMVKANVVITLALHLVFTALGVVLFTPLIAVLGRLALHFSSYEVLADTDILFFFLSRVGFAGAAPGAFRCFFFLARFFLGLVFGFYSRFFWLFFSGFFVRRAFDHFFHRRYCSGFVPGTGYYIQFPYIVCARYYLRLYELARYLDRLEGAYHFTVSNHV